MRVATDQGQIEQLLEAALSMMVGNLTDDQRHAGKVLMNRLELTPEQTVRLLLAHPQMLDQIAENGARQIGSALDTLTSMLGLSKEELEKGSRRAHTSSARATSSSSASTSSATS